jgi:hypothetical protein
MQERRQGARDKVLFGGRAEINERGSTLECVVRNFSEHGACIEFDSSATLPDQLKLTVARKGRAYIARMIWRQANRVGLALQAMITDAPAESDLDARLRRSEKKKRQLQRRINQLLGEG